MLQVEWGIVVVVGGAPVAERLAEAVQGDGHDHDGDADLHPGADVQAG